MTVTTTCSPPAREAFAVVLEFSAAAERLAAMASDWRQGQFRKTDTTTAANAIEGMRVLLGELRATNANED
jgi:hypothetical protein